MKYEPIEFYGSKEIEQKVFSNNLDVQAKLPFVYSAAYNFDVHDAADFLLHVLKFGEFELRKAVIQDVIGAYMQFRQTSFKADEFIAAIQSTNIGGVFSKQNVINEILEFKSIFN